MLSCLPCFRVYCYLLYFRVFLVNHSDDLLIFLKVDFNWRNINDKSGLKVIVHDNGELPKSALNQLSRA